MKKWIKSRKVIIEYIYTISLDCKSWKYFLQIQSNQQKCNIQLEILQAYEFFKSVRLLIECSYRMVRWKILTVKNFTANSFIKRPMNWKCNLFRRNRYVCTIWLRRIANANSNKKKNLVNFQAITSPSQHV